MGASGMTTVNFGSFPGSAETSTDVVGQSGLVSTSEVEAWLHPTDTSDHSADEHLIENVRVIGRYLADGQIRIHAYVVPFPQLKPINAQTNAPGATGASDAINQPNLLYGQFTVGWVWA